MTQQRLSKKQINKLYKEYSEYFNGDETQIAFELAKDFIYNASREYERFINQSFSGQRKKIRFWIDVLNRKSAIRNQALAETAEYLRPQKTIKETFEERIAKEQFKSK